MVCEATQEEQEAGRRIPNSVDGKKEHRRSACSILLSSLFIVGFLVLVILPLILAIEVILCCFALLFSAMMIPLAVLVFLIERLNQLLRNGDAYLKATIRKAVIRVQILQLTCITFLIDLGIFYILASKVSKIKHITLYDLSLRHWTQVTCMIIGLYALNFFLSYLVAKLSPPMVWQYERGINAAQAATEIIDCLMLWLVTTLVLKHVPSFKQHHVLGLSTHKLIKVVLFILIAIDTIAFFCHFITFLLYKFFKSVGHTFHVKSKWHKCGEEIPDGKMYWADGLRKNIVFIFGSMVLFISWNSYFRTHLNATQEDKKAVRFVTMALASLFILAVLWLIKSCIVLAWKANQVYGRLKPRLIANREELYFLGILGRHKFDILSIEGNSPLATEPLNSTRPHRVRRRISHNEQQEKDPVDKKRSVMTASREKNIYVKCLIKLRKLLISCSKTMSGRDVRDNKWHEEKYVGIEWFKLIDMILVGDCGISYIINLIFRKVVRLVSYSELSKIVREDLYMLKAQENVEKDEKKDVEKEEQEDVEKDEQEVKVRGSEIMYATLHDLQKMSQYFLRAQPTLCSDKYVPKMLHFLTTPAANGKRNLEEHLKQLIKYKTSESQEEYEWDWFKDLVEAHSKATNEVPSTSTSNEINKSIKSEPGTPSCKLSSVEGSDEPDTTTSNEIKESFESSAMEVNNSSDSPSNETKVLQQIEEETLKAWLENARGTCMELANTLSSAEEVVNCLDNIMSGLLIGATFIMWLLLTGLATTKILVLIASPLLAATFIFGDTCKCLFQGIIFAYVCNPINVGDLIIIDGKMMVVKILGVWKTIFVEIGKADEVIYPNSELVNKKIINYKSDFDWNDCLEFSLKLFKSVDTEKLMDEIEQYLKKDERCWPNHISTEVLVTEEDVKVIIHLKYNIDNQHEMTLYECLQKKRNRRSLFTLKIWDLLNEHKTKKD